MQRKHPLAKCEECPFATTGGFVPTLNLNPKSRIAVVGEAPGTYEAQTGKPFTGPTGRLLDQVLGHYGLYRDDVMYTNAALCRENSEDDVPKAAISACAPRLHAELEGIDQVLAMGKTAVHHILGTKQSMRKLRIGPGKPYPLDQNVTVIPTWHPAFCLRSPDAFPDFVTDTGKLVNRDKKQWVEPDYRVLDDPDTTVRALETLVERGYLEWVIDIEVGVDKDEAFVHPSEYRMLCLGIAFAKKKAIVIGENAINHPKVWAALERLLRLVRIVAHNGKFDLAGLRRLVGVQKLFFDTMLASYTLEERPGHHGLKPLSIERLGAPAYDDEIHLYVPKGGNYADIPRDILYRYNAYDVVCTWDLKEVLSGEFTPDDWKKHNFLIEISNSLIELELNGVPFDEIYSKEVETEYANKLAVVEEELFRIAGKTFNPRSVPQVNAYYAEHGLILPTTGADFLKELLNTIEGDTFDFTKQLLEHRKLSKLKGTFVTGLAKRVYEGRVYTTYLIHGTTSGRLSSRGPNLQNVVREKSIRNQFTASSLDRVLVQLDYSQAEGRVITHLAQEDYLAEIFRDPTRDIFAEFCNDIFGIGKWTKEQRVTIKSIFYGNAYGRKAPSIARALQLQGSSITLEETQQLMNDFNALIPKVKKWQASIKKQVLAGESLTTPFGRKRSFWLITDRNRNDVLNEALSFKPQSIASDICARAMVKIIPRLRESEKGILRMTIHDALIAECYEKDIDFVSGIMEEEMLASATQFTTYVPFKVDRSFGYRWGQL